MIPHCSFDLHFSNNEQKILSILACVYESSVCLLWRNVFLGLFPTFDWAVCFSGVELCDLLLYFGN